MRTDGSPSGDGRGLIAGGLSRLRSLGFLTAVRVRKIRIISREDSLFAGYEMDATASTLVNLVIIPLVLGSILFSHSAFTFQEAMVIVVLLVLTSWGLDILILVMMLRHEIYQIASEIRAIMRARDSQKIDPHHLNLSPEDLLATAYYYERNGLVRKCEAYLAHLITMHADSFEGVLAMEQMERVEGIRDRPSAARTREGERKTLPAPRRKVTGIKKMASLIPGRKGEGVKERDENGRVRGSVPRHRRWFGLPAAGGKKRKEEGSSGESYQQPGKSHRDVLPLGKRLFPKAGPRETLAQRAIRKRRERLVRREDFVNSPDEKTLAGSARIKLGLSRLLHWESREERRYRRKQERWLHGPRAPKPVRRSEGSAHKTRQWRPYWLRSRAERQALNRQKRWSEGLSGPGSTQKSRDRWGRWRLLAGAGRSERLTQERREKAVGEPPYG